MAGHSYEKMFRLRIENPGEISEPRPRKAGILRESMANSNFFLAFTSSPPRGMVQMQNALRVSAERRSGRLAAHEREVIEDDPS